MKKVPGSISCCRVAILGFTFLFSQSIFAWGELGHGAVGLIAEKNLTPNAQKMVQNIIGLESLAIAANWPDLIRSDERFKDFAPYHYIEETADKDARTIIEEAPKRILDKKASREEKMIWLRYIIHVVGDLHQPLHVGNGLDRGGNMCVVKYEGDLTNLHTFWMKK